MVNESSVSLGSSRASASEGPDQPPSFKNILIGAISLPSKYSAIFWVADWVTSTIIMPPCDKNKPATVRRLPILNPNSAKINTLNRNVN